jgi:hypothetical protein
MSHALLTDPNDPMDLLERAALGEQAAVEQL